MDPRHISIDPIEHDIARDDTCDELSALEDTALMAARAHGVISGAVAALVMRIELPSVIAMLDTVKTTIIEHEATESHGGRIA